MHHSPRIACILYDVNIRVLYYSIFYYSILSYKRYVHYFVILINNVRNYKLIKVNELVIKMYPQNECIRSCIYIYL